MSRYICALYGHSNCGKSATLNHLRELLRVQGESTHLQSPSGMDRRETFLFHGKTICLTPGGDDEQVMKDNLLYFDRQGADILVTASRSRGGTVDVIQEYRRTGDIHVKWVRKSYEYNLSQATQNLCNEETARYLLSWLCGKCG